MSGIACTHTDKLCRERARQRPSKYERQRQIDDKSEAMFAPKRPPGDHPFLKTHVYPFIAESTAIDSGTLTPVAAATPALPNWERGLGGEGQTSLSINISA